MGYLHKIKRLGKNKLHLLIYGITLSLITTILTTGYLMNSDNPPRVQNEATNPPEVQHIVFLKVHKAASTTMMNLFIRYGVSHNLKIMIPKSENTFSQQAHLRNSDILHYSTDGLYDILCCHVIYNKAAIAPHFPPDTRYIGILRDPFKQFLSAFNYYLTVSLITLKGHDNLLMRYLQDPLKYEPEYHYSSFTNNRMSLDFGYPPKEFKNLTYMHEYLNHLEAEFDLVIIVDYFDESLLMMKRMLGWKLQDLMYIPRKRFRKFYENYTEEGKAMYRKWAQLDYLLYERFLDIFLKKLEQQPPSFYEELGVFRSVRKRVQKFCTRTNDSYMQVKDTWYNEVFIVTRFDCKYMLMEARNLIDTVREGYVSNIRKPDFRL